jgi:hypothetical protein
MEAEVNDYVTFKENKHTYIAERDHWRAKRDLQRVNHETKLEEIEHDKIV